MIPHWLSHLEGRLTGLESWLRYDGNKKCQGEEEEGGGFGNLGMVFILASDHGQV